MEPASASISDRPATCCATYCPVGFHTSPSRAYTFTRAAGSACVPTSFDGTAGTVPRECTEVTLPRCTPPAPAHDTHDPAFTAVAVASVALTDLSTVNTAPHSGQVMGSCTDIHAPAE